MKIYNTYKDKWKDHFGYKMTSILPYIIVREYSEEIDVNVGWLIWYLHFSIKK